MTKPITRSEGAPVEVGPKGALRRAGAWMRRAIVENGAIKLVSLALAVTLFVLVNVGQESSIRFEMGVSYSVSADQVLHGRVDSVAVTLRGSWRRIRRFDERELGRLHIDLRARDGDSARVRLRDYLGRLPHGLELVSVEPEVFTVNFEPLVSKSVPVRVLTVGKPVETMRLSRARAAPPNVTVRGAESVVSAIHEVVTLGVSLDGRSSSFVESVPLPAIDGVDFARVNQVRVSVELVEELARRVVDDVPVVIRASEPGVDLSGQYSVAPATVQVVLHGGAAALAAAVAEQVTAYVTVAPGETGGRLAEVAVDVSGVGHEVLPRAVTVVRRLAKP